jgi:hypothetical protein
LYVIGRTHVWISTRQRFQYGDPKWEAYITRMKLPHLREVRTLDAALNKDVDDCGDMYCELSQVKSVLEMLPRPARDREYYLLGRLQEAVSAAAIHGFAFLGCDLSDESMTSSVLNCGPWMGRLAG